MMLPPLMPSERIIILRTEQPRQVLVDVCSALADAVNEPPVWQTTDTELLTVYAEAVLSLARLQRAGSVVMVASLVEIT